MRWARLCKVLLGDPIGLTATFPEEGLGKSRLSFLFFQDGVGWAELGQIGLAQRFVRDRPPLSPLLR